MECKLLFFQCISLNPSQFKGFWVKIGYCGQIYDYNKLLGATEPVYAGNNGAIETWLIDWLIINLCYYSQFSTKCLEMRYSVGRFLLYIFLTFERRDNCPFLLSNYMKRILEWPVPARYWVKILQWRRQKIQAKSECNRSCWGHGVEK